jgi:hypothetical protein
MYSFFFAPRSVQDRNFDQWITAMRCDGIFEPDLMAFIERGLRRNRQVMVVRFDWFFSELVSDFDEDEAREPAYALVVPYVMNCTLETFSTFHEAITFCNSIGLLPDIQVWPDAPLWAPGMYN